MFGEKLKKAFELKPHMVDCIFQYRNFSSLSDLNKCNELFLVLGKFRLRPVVIGGVFELIGNIGGNNISVTKHSESKLKGQKSVQSFEVRVCLETSHGSYLNGLVVSEELLDMKDGEKYFKDQIAKMVSENIENHTLRLLEG